MRHSTGKFVVYAFMSLVTLGCGKKDTLDLQGKEVDSELSGSMEDNWEKYRAALKNKNWDLIWDLLAENSRKNVISRIIRLKDDWRNGSKLNEIEEDTNASYGELIDTDDKELWIKLLNSIYNDKNYEPDPYGWEIEDIKVVNGKGVVVYRDDYSLRKINFIKEDGFWRMATFYDPLWTKEDFIVETLEQIHRGQNQFKRAEAVDMNKNGIGEYGFFEELGGSKPCRGTGHHYKVNPFIPQALGKIDNNLISYERGYYYKLYLPKNSNSGTSNMDETIEYSATETFFIVYSWPKIRSVVNNRLLVINNEGKVYYKFPSSYIGNSKFPKWDEALKIKKGWKWKIGGPSWKQY